MLHLNVLNLCLKRLFYTTRHCTPDNTSTCEDDEQRTAGESNCFILTALILSWSYHDTYLCVFYAAPVLTIAVLTLTIVTTRTEWIIWGASLGFRNTLKERIMS